MSRHACRAKHWMLAATAPLRPPLFHRGWRVRANSRQAARLGVGRAASAGAPSVERLEPARDPARLQLQPVVELGGAARPASRRGGRRACRAAASATPRTRSRRARSSRRRLRAIFSMAVFSLSAWMNIVSTPRLRACSIACSNRRRAEAAPRAPSAAPRRRTPTSSARPRDASASRCARWARAISSRRRLKMPNTSSCVEVERVDVAADLRVAGGIAEAQVARALVERDQVSGDALAVARAERADRHPGPGPGAAASGGGRVDRRGRRATSAGRCGASAALKSGRTSWVT